MMKMAKDPVCGMQVKVEGAKWTSEHEGTRWYFCSEGCKKRFEADPAKYEGARLAAGSGGLAAVGGMSAVDGTGCCGGGGTGGAAVSSTTGVEAGAGGSRFTCP